MYITIMLNVLARINNNSGQRKSPPNTGFEILGSEFWGRVRGLLFGF